MTKLKAQLHIHSKQDPLDHVKFTEKQIIDRAAKLGYQVLAITCHNVVIFSDDLKKYAEKKRILLIPGIEKTIDRKHVLILNADVNAQKINSFEELKNYKEKRKDCFIIAPHPFYHIYSLRKALQQNISLFDAVENSWFHTKRFNKANKKALKIAEQNNLPVICTSDNHLIEYFDQGYCLIEAEKNVSSIVKAIRANKVENISHSLSWWQYLIVVPFKMGISQIIKFFI